MLKYKLLLKLFVLSCMLICCICGDTIQAEVVVLCLQVMLSTAQHNLQTHHHLHTHSISACNSAQTILYKMVQI